MPDVRAVLERCDVLARCSEEPGRLTRRFATPALAEARELVAGWMREAGLEPRCDAVGNLIGRRDGPGPTLLLGSHLDSVRDAGRYDGPLGVLLALAAAERMRERPLPFALEVVAFADEEGVRYGTAYLGSALLAGRFETGWLERRDADGVAMADAIRGWGGDPAAVAGPARDDLLALSARSTSSRAPCSTTRAAGRRGRGDRGPDARVRDLRGHRGPRRDDADGRAPRRARRGGGVDRRGRGGRPRHRGAGRHGRGARRRARARRTSSPAGSWPRSTCATPTTRAREDAVRALRERAAAAGAARGGRGRLGGRPGHARRAAATRPSPTTWRASRRRSPAPRVPRLASGAGHDAVMLSTVTPVAMLFVRCERGISHHPAEAVRAEDVAVALDVTTRLLEELAA